METYPTRNGIAIPVWDLALPASCYGDNERYKNNHHNEWSARQMGRSAVTQALRDLERHQYRMPVDVHQWLHDTYAPPALPTEEQAAREVIDAYESGERFKIYGRKSHEYYKKDIPLTLVDELIARYGLQRVFPMAAD